MHRFKVNAKALCYHDHLDGVAVDAVVTKILYYVHVVSMMSEYVITGDQLRLSVE